MNSILNTVCPLFSCRKGLHFMRVNIVILLGRTCVVTHRPNVNKVILHLFIFVHVKQINRDILLWACRVITD